MEHVSTHELSQITLDSINVPQEKDGNKKNLEELGHVDGLAKALELNFNVGLTAAQVTSYRARYGENIFPEPPMSTYLEMLLDALSDPVLIVLIIAAAVSLGIGIYDEGPEHGWIEGGAIFIAVFLVSNITAGNDYSKQFQFRALKKTSEGDDRCSVFRDGVIELINPKDIVVGDILVLQVIIHFLF
jgi:magnesium-transporting ATPase (P-type)